MILTKVDFHSFKVIIFHEIGMDLDDNKLNLVQSRLYSRIIHYQLESFRSYLNIIKTDYKEMQIMVNLITTNETYFFRETQHFDFISSIIKKMKKNEFFRIWSAASSVGAEAYSIAMILDDLLNINQWDVIASDINTQVIKNAKQGLYCESWIDKIPLAYKTKYCLKGKGRFEGKFIIDRKLSNKISFKTNNLTILNTKFGKFNIIFLRNILIYFNLEIKQKVLNNVLSNLNIGGYLIISLTENLEELDTKCLKKYQNSIYKKVSHK